MKYAITSVNMSSLTRRRMGKATTTVIDTDAADKLFEGCETPLDVERRYEQLHNAGVAVPGVKVVDIKTLDVRPEQPGPVVCSYCKGTIKDGDTSKTPSHGCCETCFRTGKAVQA